MPADSPPPPHEGDLGPDDWTPYNDRVGFELADFLYTREQMSGSNIDHLLMLWAASQAAHDDVSPFTNHSEMYKMIDSTPLGDVQWDNFSCQYNGELPENDVPSWMTAKYEVWFRNPRELVKNLVLNPDFDGEFDYAPLQEYDQDNNHRFQNFMSGNWAWKQGVSLPRIRVLLFLRSYLGANTGYYR